MQLLSPPYRSTLKDPQRQTGPMTKRPFCCQKCQKCKTDMIHYITFTQLLSPPDRSMHEDFQPDTGPWGQRNPSMVKNVKRMWTFHSTCRTPAFFHRSMREDPQPDKPMDEKTFFGDNFVRKSGDYLAWQDLQVHALQSGDKGVDLNVMVSMSDVHVVCVYVCVCGPERYGEHVWRACGMCVYVCLWTWTLWWACLTCVWYVCVCVCGSECYGEHVWCVVCVYVYVCGPEHYGEHVWHACVCLPVCVLVFYLAVSCLRAVCVNVELLQGRTHNGGFRCGVCVFEPFCLLRAHYIMQFT